jgi:hypothetical protein
MKVAMAVILFSLVSLSSFAQKRTCAVYIDAREGSIQDTLTQLDETGCTRTQDAKSADYTIFIHPQFVCGTTSGWLDRQTVRLIEESHIARERTFHETYLGPWEAILWKKDLSEAKNLSTDLYKKKNEVDADAEARLERKWLLKLFKVIAKQESKLGE